MRSPYVALMRLLSLFAVLVSIGGMSFAPNPFTVASVVGSSKAAIPNTNVNVLGANFFLDAEVEPWKREQTLKMAREAGITWVKMLFTWEGLEPKKGQFFDDKLKKSTWEKFDDIVALTQKYGMRIIARLDRPPDWSRNDNRFKTAPPDDFDDYARFVATVVKHFKGRIQYYQLWNEPNIFPEWGDRAPDPASYVKLLKVAYTAAKEADPNVLILSAPMAQTLEKSDRNLDELDYWEAAYKAGAKDYFDIMLANGYGFDRPPSDPPDPSVLNFQRVKLLREIMERNGDGNKAMWLSEYGWNACPESFTQDKAVWRQVTEQQQADYIAEGIRLAQSWGWIGVINIWYFRQVGNIPGDRCDYYFRMVDTDFTPRLSLYKLKDLAATLQVASPGLHEETDPALNFKGSWTPLLRKDASAGGVFSSSKAGDTATLTFDGTGVKLLYLADESSGRLQVKVDGQNYSVAVGKNKGSNYIDLFAGEPGQASETVVDGLSPGRHTLELIVSSETPPGSKGRNCAIDAFEVVSQPSFLTFYTLGALLVAGMLGLIGSLLPRRAD